MKYLAFILILMIGAQPAQAGFCEMDLDKSQDTPHHMADSDTGGHDCCDADKPESSDDCESGMNCGFCFASVPLLPGFSMLHASWLAHYSVEFTTGSELPSHSTPLFRPPIS